MKKVYLLPRAFLRLTACEKRKVKNDDGLPALFSY